MPEGLLLETSGLVLKVDDGDLPRADHWQKGDERHLARILYGLAALHRYRGKALGNIDEASLRRTEKDQLVLHCDMTTDSESKCERAAHGTPEARYYLHAGQNPREADDLAALGVAAAELVVLRASRPSPEGDATSYRAALAEKLNGDKRRANRHRNSLIRALLTADAQQKTAGFVRKHLPLLVISENGLQPAAVADVARRYRNAVLAGVAAVVLVLVSTWWLWNERKQLIGEKGTLLARVGKLEQAKEELAQQTHELGQNVIELKTANDQLLDTNGKLESEIRKLRKYISGQGLPGPDTDPEPKLPNPIPDDRGTEIFQAELQSDDEFQRILRKPTISSEELAYAQEQLTHYQQAARLWWEFVEERMDLATIQLRIDAAESDGVRKILKRWLAEAMHPQVYSFVLVESRVPADYHGWDFRITINDAAQRLNATKEGEDATLGLEGSDAPPILRVPWKAGQPLHLWLESGAYTHWSNILDVQFTNTLNLPRLAVYSYRKNGHRVKFRVEPLPGAPVKSRRLLKRAAPTDDSSTPSSPSPGSGPAVPPEESETTSDELRIDPMEELN